MLAYRDTLEKLEQVAGQKFAHILVIDGGAKSILLNQLIASIAKILVIAGPLKAKATGNLCKQYLATGESQNLIDLHQVVKASYTLHEFRSENSEEWEAAYERFLMIKSK